MNPDITHTNKTLLIHIGFPKAASTTLQKGLFDKIENAKYLGTLPTSNIGFDNDYSFLNKEYILNSHGIHDFHDILIGSRERNPEIEKRFFEYLDNIKEDKIILSNEKITSSFFSEKKFLTKAYRIKEFFPNAKILVVIRNQFDILESQYRDRPFIAQDNFTGKGVRYNDWIKYILENDNELEYLKILDYSNIICTYKDFFGNENVYPVLFEELVEKKENAITSLSKFLSESTDDILSRLDKKILNISNPNSLITYRILKRNKPIYFRYFMKFLCQLGLQTKIESILIKGAKRKYRLSSGNRKLLINRFNDGNSILKNRFQLSIKNYNYPLYEN